MSSLITVTTTPGNSVDAFLKAISSGTKLPREVIIIDLTGKAEVTTPYEFMVKIQPLEITHDKSATASAFNLAIRKAWEEHLIFLDVNCFPGPAFIQKMEEHLKYASGLIVAEPRTLKKPVNDSYNLDDLFGSSIYNNLRPDLKKELTLCFNPDLFWGQGFGIRREDILHVNGFSESYKADSSYIFLDFVNRLSKANKDFYLSKNTYYQPVHFGTNALIPEKVVNDSNYFYKSWGYWPRTDILETYANEGIIKWNAQQEDEITLIGTSKNQTFIQQGNYAAVG